MAAIKLHLPPATSTCMHAQCPLAQKSAEPCAAPVAPIAGCCGGVLLQGEALEVLEGQVHHVLADPGLLLHLQQPGRSAVSEKQVRHRQDTRILGRVEAGAPSMANRTLPGYHIPAPGSHFQAPTQSPASSPGCSTGCCWWPLHRPTHLRQLRWSQQQRPCARAR